ncbi:MAG: MspA family porin [Nocardiaceae bacterium]|nr:MspA family porin [Nocardiaceae bacterium]
MGSLPNVWKFPSSYKYCLLFKLGGLQLKAKAFAVVGCAALSVVAAVAAPASAADQLLPPHKRVIATDDGWRVTVGGDREVVNVVRSINAALTTREAIVTNRAFATLGGSGAPIKSVTLKSGYQIGCNVNLNTAGTGASTTIGGTNLTVSPFVNVSVEPGQVVDLNLGEKDIRNGFGSINIHGLDVHVDSCLGMASLRSYSIVKVSTQATDDLVAVYGKIVNF